MAEEIITEAPVEEPVKETPVEEVVTETPTEGPVSEAPVKKFFKKFGANLKERWRKFLVSLKRKPQQIAFLPLLVSTVLWMIGIVYFGQTSIYDDLPGMGLCIFVNTMFSILTLVLFMNTFPKRAKHMNYVMLALTFAFIAVMIACDVVWYVRSYPAHMAAYDLAISKGDTNALTKIEPGLKSFPLIITHLVFVCLSTVLLATLPLYKKLLLKINTAKVVEENKLSEEIDTSAEV